ncbi:MAG: alkaline phosphatase D family protein [Alphaproteobacteria bacterium]|nr:alkaline phosphatase D family protein [Alphaproteobacteria bacterium]
MTEILPVAATLIRRRHLLGGVGSLAAFGLLAPPARRAAHAEPRFTSSPFTLGVASGEPWPESVVLWTRLAPEPLDGGGMPPEPVEIRWQLAADARFRTGLRQGVVVAQPELAHSVRVEVGGLQPGRPYWYRFIVGGVESPVGRTRTAPPANAAAQGLRLRLAAVGCSNYEHGWFTAYGHLAAEDLDLVFHSGDYIYEGRARGNRPFRHGSQAVRQHRGGEARTLAEYRNRYALYKTDTDLQAAHAAHPFAVTFDDHEVRDNWAGATAPGNPPREQFLLRRAAAFQAWYEHMPLRRAQLPRGADIRAHRHLDWGRLARLAFLDTRQHRTPQPCGIRRGARCAGALDPGATMLGSAQERWLFDTLGASRARWHVLGQQVPVMQIDRAPGPEQVFSMDKWDGYAAARARLLGFIAARRIANPVVLTGDLHEAWAGELKADFDDPRSATLGVEFCGTSISSDGDGREQDPNTPRILADNPHLKFFSRRRGYLLQSYEAGRLVTAFREVPYVERPGAPVATRRRFAVEAGAPGLKEG